MRMTEFIALVNKEVPDSYVFSHLDFTSIKKDKKIKKFIREINKKKKISGKREIEDIDIFEDE